MLKHYWAGIAAGLAILLAVAAGARAEDARRCYPLATLQISFAVVFPEATQFVLRGKAAQLYLKAYNEFGVASAFEGDTLLLTKLPQGTVLLVPLKDGEGCKRLIVGPKLHRIIQHKITRGQI